MTDDADALEHRVTPTAVLSLKEACRYLHLGEREVRRLCSVGEVEAFTTRGGGAWRIPIKSCDAYIARQLAQSRAARAVRP